MKKQRPFRGLAALAALTGAVAAQARLAWLPTQALPATGLHTQATELLDFDGDGDLDLMLGNGGWPGFSQNQLFRNDGYGVFVDVTSQMMPIATNDTEALAAADFDGDGDVDVVATQGNSGYGRIRYYRNEAGAGFTLFATNLPGATCCNETHDTALGDVDNDGDLDVVVARHDGPYQSGQDVLMRNVGFGSPPFAMTMVTGVTGATLSVDLADIDRDGDLDLLTLPSTGIPQLFENNGAGVFTATPPISLPALPPSYFRGDIVSGDLNGDGDMDVVVGNDAGPARILLNQGGSLVASGNLATATRIKLADIDDDGDLDAILGRESTSVTVPTLWLNDGSGAFSLATGQMSAPSGRFTDLAVGDVDFDGDLDVVIGRTFTVFGGLPTGLTYNLGRHIDAPDTVAPGQTFTLTAFARGGGPAGTYLAAAFLSAAASSAATPIGALWIDPALAAAFPLLVIPQPQGDASTSFVVPNVASLVGQEFFSQALHARMTGEIRLGNALRTRVQ